MHTARRTDSYDGFHTEEIVKLVGIDAHARHAHTAGHHGEALALIKPRVALNAADVIDKFIIGQVGLRNVLCAERVARHQHGFCKILRAAADMRGQVCGLHKNFLRTSDMVRFCTIES
ncbi:hypothetical protein SDC9_190440 [bioreactor metagenome]|uniref:Uncharacterized protein n=1 Tax=bioreactor metagenome TaxID=1076179 RepID=A0A645HWN3_9ZZZZ